MSEFWARRAGPGRVLVARDVALGLAWAGVGLWRAIAGTTVTGAVVAVVLIASSAVALFRRAPTIAVLLMGVAGAVQVLTGTALLIAEAGVLVVAYGVARHGRPLTTWLGGVAIPLGAALSEYYAFAHRSSLPATFELVAPLVRYNGLGVGSIYVLGLAVLGAPWALGLIVRLNARYRRSLAERDRAEAQAVAAQEVAALRAGQAELARDVHDLVGHSLAVIIAQADAAQVAAGDDISAVRVALDNIAAVARESLGDVREVLSRPHEVTAPAAPPDLDVDALLARARTAGTDIRLTTHGTPSAVGPAVDAVRYRVLQEMLTNAIKHGERGGRIEVEQTWNRDEVTVRVRNPVAPDAYPVAAAGRPGMGLTGMQLRLRDVGGSLSRTDANGAVPPCFTVTARIPLAPHPGAA